ncbi:tol-pal system YbgF family protein [Bacteroidota bacterium]
MNRFASSFMGRFFLIITGILFLSSSYASADGRKALKQLERKEFDKVIITLQKDLEKDSINPEARYIFSLLYMDELFGRKNIDTAYQHILASRDDYNIQDEKARIRLDKLGINKKTISLQKTRIEHAAFRRSQYDNSIESFKDFLLRFSESDKVEEAKNLRNALAFQNAKSVNTFLSYQNFMEMYPEAHEVQEASQMFDKLLYEEKTADGSLESYEGFIRYFPSSPYINNAKEMVFAIQTSANNIQSYIDFLHRYPETQLRNRSIDYVYHIYKENNRPEDFRYEYDFLEISDSLTRVSLTDKFFMIPVYENGRYGFWDQRGVSLIEPAYEKISNDYFCGDISEDFLIVTHNNDLKIVSKRGAVIYDKDFYNVSDLGFGLLRISYNGKYGLLHKSGHLMLPIEYEDLDFLNGRYIRYKKDNQYGLQTVSGRMILEDVYDNIREEGPFIIIERDRKIAVTQGDLLLPGVTGKITDLKFLYDDIELVDQGSLLCFMDGKETVIGKDLKMQIEFVEQEIYEIPGGWLVKRDTLYELYDEIFYNLAGPALEKVETKGDLVSVMRGGKYALYDFEGAFPKEFHFDSVSLLSEQIAIVRRNNEYKVIFRYGGLRDLYEPEKSRLLKPSGSELTMEYLVTENQKGSTIVYNKFGKEVLRGKATNIQALGDEYLVYTKNRKVGMSDSSGRVLLKAEYDGIANYNKGYVTTLKDKKFGLYNRHIGLKISPQYDVSPRPYNDQLIIAARDRLYGFIDHTNTDVTPFEFTDIQYWNDSTALCRTAYDAWILYDIYDQSVDIDGITNFHTISQSPKERIILFTSEEQFGIASNLRGLIINPSFSDIVNIGNINDPIYFTEKYIPEAEFFVVIYYNKSGEILRKQVFTQAEYGNIYCE